MHTFGSSEVSGKMSEGPEANSAAGAAAAAAEPHALLGNDRCTLLYTAHAMARTASPLMSASTPLLTTCDTYHTRFESQELDLRYTTNSWLFSNEAGLNQRHPKECASSQIPMHAENPASLVDMCSM